MPPSPPTAEPYPGPGAPSPGSSSAPPRVSAAVVRQRKEGGWLFGVVAKRTYQIEHGRCRVAAKQVPLVEEPELDPDADRLLHDSDLIITRAATDVIVAGTARSQRPQAHFSVSIRVGELSRELLVFGERRLELDRSGRAAFSPAVPVTEVPLTWDEAYGGVDHVGLEEIGDPFVTAAAASDAPIPPTASLYAYPRNPFGKGYLIEPSPAAVDSCRLPRLEHPWSRITPETIVRRHFVTWPKAPIPAGTGWLGYQVFPRTAQLGLPPPLYDEAAIRPEDFHEVQTRVLAARALDTDVPLGERLDVAGLSQAAAVGMRAPELVPGAPVRLTQLHPTEPAWSFNLAADVPRMAYRLPGQSADVLVPRMRCLVLEPDADRVTMLWVGTRPLDVPLTAKQIEAVEHGVVWP